MAAAEPLDCAADVVERTRSALEPLRDPTRAGPMGAYMRDVAPFLGVGAPARRRSERDAWRGLARPTADQLGVAAASLWVQPEREYAYAACDLLARFVRVADAGFLQRVVEPLLVTRPWWDTVDALGTAAVTPLVVSYPGLVATMWRWSDSGDRWLVRAAIQHQRGRRGSTDVPLVLALCHAHAGEREPFVAKAVGWALRDLAAVDPRAVAVFVAEHPGLPGLARREAERGVVRRIRAADA